MRRSAASITPKVVISNNVCPQLPVLPKTLSYLPELRWFGNNTIAIAEIQAYRLYYGIYAIVQRRLLWRRKVMVSPCCSETRRRIFNDPVRGVAP